MALLTQLCPARHGAHGRIRADTPDPRLGRAANAVWMAWRGGGDR